MQIDDIGNIISWVLPTITAIGMGIGWLRTIRNREAEAAKVEAETDSIASKEWRNLYEKMLERCDNADERISLLSDSSTIQAREITFHAARIERHREDIGKLQAKLAEANDYIDYLFEGVNVLIEQIIAMGVTPKFIPKSEFRGGKKPPLNDEGQRV